MFLLGSDGLFTAALNKEIVDNATIHHMASGLFRQQAIIAHWIVKTHSLLHFPKNQANNDQSYTNIGEKVSPILDTCQYN
ncbi:hypothetical protein GDO81_007992 [Engystomops pustulosus]|uniref:Uncharacterized protein n=1 Tax=Engystomops pustulosus TaxID=76066 RepID=A0AAV7CC63_ENGPU|nr:hypothetical protein GDO81_007992 [Engystomops pustulosus]